MLTNTNQGPLAFSRNLREEGSHWYGINLVTGEITSEYDKNLRHARAALLNPEGGPGPGLFPSATTIMGAMLAKPELNDYKEIRAIAGTVQAMRDRASGWIFTQRDPGESDSAYASRQFSDLLPSQGDIEFAKKAAYIADTPKRDAAGFGEAMHSKLELLACGMPVAEDEFSPYFKHLEAWFNDNVSEVHFSERNILANVGYAGKSDLGLTLKNGALVIADLKNTKWKYPAKSGPVPYEKYEYALQLGAYRGGARDTLDHGWENAGGILIHVNSKDPMPVAVEVFTTKELDKKQACFEHLTEIYFDKNGYFPNFDLIQQAKKQRSTRDISAISSYVANPIIRPLSDPQLLP